MSLTTEATESGGAPMSDLSTSIVRYLTGLAVGLVVAVLARYGLDAISP